ncbi:hypothetical protein DFJ74DRAFT_696333 [Hyaloraphidium curvatum]|nr:hypothetical protein DFJ74DRAFT_696333 [Hyaloraphidium curvatum]
MASAVLAALIAAHPGRDDEHNEWYNTHHIRDAVAFDGCLAGQRFAVEKVLGGDFPAKYLVLYDLDGDAGIARFQKSGGEFRKRLEEAAAKGLPPPHVLSDSVDREKTEGFFGEATCPTVFADGAVDGEPLGGLLAVLAKPVEGLEKEFAEWYDTVHLKDVISVPGFHSARRYKLVSTLAGTPPALPSLALYFIPAKEDLEGVMARLAGTMKERAEKGDSMTDRSFDGATMRAAYYRAIAKKVEKSG